MRRLALALVVLALAPASASASVGRPVPRYDAAWQAERVAAVAHDYWRDHVGSDLPACGTPSFAWATLRGSRTLFDFDPQGWADLIGCRIVIARWLFGYDPTGEPSEVHDRRSFCRLVVHEYGHLIGQDHDSRFMIMRDSNRARIKGCRR